MSIRRRAEPRSRRPPREFLIELELWYEWVCGTRIRAAGTGKTLSIGRYEILFTTQVSLPLRKRVRLRVNWPVMLGDTCLLKLEITGWVVRSEAGVTAAKIDRYEFR